MLRLKGKLKVDDIRALQTHHYVALVGNDTLLSALKKAFLFHQFEGIECPCTFESRQKDATEPTSADALDDIKVFETNLLDALLPPNGLYL